MSKYYLTLAASLEDIASKLPEIGHARAAVEVRLIADDIRNLRTDERAEDEIENFRRRFEEMTGGPRFE